MAGLCLDPGLSWNRGVALAAYKGIRGDKRFKGRGGYPVETSNHFIHQNTKSSGYSF